jgi:site-specific DNA recombinase
VVDQVKSIGRDPAVLTETLRQLRAKSDERVSELEAEDRRLRRELSQHHGELRELAKKIAFEPGEGTTRLADLQERIAASERRLADVTDEAERLARERLDDAEVAKALAEFDGVWEMLTPAEQGKLLQLLIQRVDYDGRDGNLEITFHETGFKALAGQLKGDAA